MPSSSNDSDWFCSLCGLDFKEKDAPGILTLEDKEKKSETNTKGEN